MPECAPHVPLLRLTYFGCAVAIASYGEINFVFAGFIYQCFGIAFEAARLVAIQKLLSGLKMTPLVALYNFAPVSRPGPGNRAMMKADERLCVGMCGAQSVPVAIHGGQRTVL